VNEILASRLRVELFESRCATTSDAYTVNIASTDLVRRCHSRASRGLDVGEESLCFVKGMRRDSIRSQQMSQ